MSPSEIVDHVIKEYPGALRNQLGFVLGYVGRQPTACIDTLELLFQRELSTLEQATKERDEALRQVEAAQRYRIDRDHQMSLRQEAEAALAQVQGERAWQPIETAPKDGRDILLHGSNWTRTGYWARRVERWSVDAAVQLSEPTHWAHLPLRPTTPEREEP